MFVPIIVIVASLILLASLLLALMFVVNRVRIFLCVRWFPCVDIDTRAIFLVLSLAVDARAGFIRPSLICRWCLWWFCCLVAIAMISIFSVCALISLCWHWYSCYFSRVVARRSCRWCSCWCCRLATRVHDSHADSMTSLTDLVVDACVGSLASLLSPLYPYWFCCLAIITLTVDARADFAVLCMIPLLTPLRHCITLSLIHVVAL